ncbi:MAG: phosphoadenosine phosphosulfate reductase [Actinomycetota bacterium]|jgi:phosphoadenosine phosphosulfate reductase|nr:phosphoadenosine phosphosulfate reductase [Actinomycetota bacterium]
MTAELLSLVPFEVREPVSLAEHRQALARRAAWRLEDAPAEVVIRWAARTFGARLALTSSMSDAVVIDLFAKHAPGTDVVFLDTGYHFPETIGMRDAVAATYRGRINVVTVQPEQTVAQQDATHGRDLFATNPDGCCALRKVAPLDAALAPYDAWASGLRRDESFARSITPVVDWDKRNGKVKINPIARWTQDKVDAYIEKNNVLVNTLLMDGYASIGCFPCTRRVSDGEGTRDGRWAGTGKSECGIHLVSSS